MTPTSKASSAQAPRLQAYVLPPPVGHAQRGMSGSYQSVRRRDSVFDRLRVAVEERPRAFPRLGLEGPAVSCVARDDVKVEVEDRLEGDFAVTKEDVDPLAAHA